MTYAAQWKLHGDTKWPYHAVNCVLHAAVAACVAEFTRRLTQKSSSAFVAGLLFAVHPIHVEAVANVVGRAELLAALGVLGGLILFLHRPLTILRSLAIFGCFVLAALSKENGILLPPLLLVLALCVRFRSAEAKERRAAVALVLMLCWSLAGYLLLRESILKLKFEWDRNLLDWTINPLIRTHGADRFLMPIVCLGHYVALLIAPIKLSPDYGATVIGFQKPYFVLGLTAIAACAFAFIIAIRRGWRLTVFCLIALALTYGVISNFVILIGTNFAERLMYLPSAFFVILISMALCWFVPRRVVVAIVAILVVLGSARSFAYARQWNDRLSFYRTSIANQPNSIRLRMLLIAELMSRSELEAADQEAKSARDLLPQYDEIWIQSADVAMARNDLDRAESCLRRAMALGRGAKAANRLQLIFEKRAKR